MGELRATVSLLEFPDTLRTTWYIEIHSGLFCEYFGAARRGMFPARALFRVANVLFVPRVRVSRVGTYFTSLWKSARDTFGIW